jgi:hypothetical protein
MGDKSKESVADQLRKIAKEQREAGNHTYAAELEEKALELDIRGEIGFDGGALPYPLFFHPGITGATRSHHTWSSSTVLGLELTPPSWMDIR